MLLLIAILVGLLLVLFGIGVAGGVGAMWMSDRIANRRRPALLSLPIGHPDARNVMGPVERDRWDDIIADLASDDAA